ncbi:hypothetical protein ALT761_00314 [Alteromonas sp. 76-1]|jgi:hypothetical protein|nr:hypothetical protein ALT761_00314 [Alteromonas sp. 76-1]
MIETKQSRHKPLTFIVTVFFSTQCHASGFSGIAELFFVLIAIASVILSIPSSIFSKSIWGALLTFVLLLPNFLISIVMFLDSLGLQRDDGANQVIMWTCLTTFCLGVYLIFIVTIRVFRLNNIETQKMNRPTNESRRVREFKSKTTAR